MQSVGMCWLRWVGLGRTGCISVAVQRVSALSLPVCSVVEVTVTLEFLVKKQQEDVARET
jgi:hypothetical protein